MKRRFRAKDKEYRKRAKELEEVTTRRDAVRKEFDELRKKRLTEFMDGFNTITLKLKEECSYSRDSGNLGCRHAYFG